MFKSLKSLKLFKTDGTETLFKAINTGDVKKLEKLLDKGANIETKDNNKITLLIQACINNNVEIVKLLLDKGAYIEAKDNNNRTPLINAIINNNVEIVKLLLGRGADINARDDNGNSSLVYACINNNVDLARLLLDRSRRTFIEWRYNGRNVSVLLIVCGIKNIKEEIVELLLDNGSYIEARDKYGDTPLIKAVYSDNKEIVNLLLYRRANIHATDKDGYTPLLYCCKKTNYVEMIEILLNNGSYIDIEDTDKDGNTPLLLACSNTQPKAEEIVKLLLDRGAYFQAKNNVGHGVFTLVHNNKTNRDIITELINNYFTKTEAHFTNTLPTGKIIKKKRKTRKMKLNAELIPIATVVEQENDLRHFNVTDTQARGVLSPKPIYGGKKKSIKRKTKKTHKR